MFNLSYLHIRMTEYPKRDQIIIGSTVYIETKENQGTGKLTRGTASAILTRSASHPHGIKVKLQDGSVGRVKKISDDLHQSAD